MVLAANGIDCGMMLEYEGYNCADEDMDAATLHEQLVKHVHVVSGELDTRLDVWGEHSYARARGAAANSHIRILFASHESEPESEDIVDVETPPRTLPTPPCDGRPQDVDLACDSDRDGDSDHDRDSDGDDWEERLLALAPSAPLARLATVALAALRDLRLERLAGSSGRWARGEGAAAAARRLRLALAPHWAGGAAWLHAALLAGLPPALAPLFGEVVAELRRQVPRLAERLQPAQPLASLPSDPLAVVGVTRRASAPGPWLAWAPSGCEQEDTRWLRRLRALLHTRVLRGGETGAGGGVGAAASPERWCAALAQEARAALVDMLADAGRRPVVVGGAGAGAALAAWLAAGGAGAGSGKVRGLLLLAPPLLTAEGPRDSPEDILEEVDVPLLAVVGGAAAQCCRSAAASLAGAGTGTVARRVLVVAGAEDALRLPRTLRRRRALPQHALDAAIVEECARWAQEAAETPEPTRDRGRRKGAGASVAALECEDVRPVLTGNRSIDIIEGRVVSRAAGGAPLSLLPPRLAAADILQLPIVFADDDPAPTLAAAPDPELTVRSGRGGSAPAAAVRYARVLVAKRGAPRRRAPQVPRP